MEYKINLVVCPSVCDLKILSGTVLLFRWHGKWRMTWQWSMTSCEGLGCDPICLAPLSKNWLEIYRLRYNRASIGNGTAGIKWSHMPNDVTWP